MYKLVATDAAGAVCRARFDFAGGKGMCLRMDEGAPDELGPYAEAGRAVDHGEAQQSGHGGLESAHAIGRFLPLVAL